jgi:hypothetical protein
MPVNQEHIQKIINGIRKNVKEKREELSDDIDYTLNIQEHYQATYKHSYIIRDLVYIRKQNEDEAHETILELTETKPNNYEYEDFRNRWESDDELNDRWLDEAD